MKIAGTIRKFSELVFRSPILTGVILSMVPAFVSAAIVGVLVWTLLSYVSCFGVPGPIWAWRPLTHLSWWVCLITGIALVFLILLSFVGVSGFKTRIANLTKAFVISAVVVGVSMSMVLLILFNGDKIKDRNNYNDWDDLADDELLVQLVPRAATNIKRRDFSGFRAYQCNVSCKVSLKGLEELAKERGYNFEQVDSEGAVDFGLATQKGRNENNSFCERAFSKGKFLRCEFSRKSADGLVQHFLLCYDIVQEKLCCQYSDD